MFPLWGFCIVLHILILSIFLDYFGVFESRIIFVKSELLLYYLSRIFLLTFSKYALPLGDIFTEELVCPETMFPKNIFTYF